jgi:hypothetical protein
MECAIAIATFIKLISDIFAPCVKMFADNSEAKRQLRVDVETWKKAYQELKSKYVATELRLRAKEEKSATQWGAIVVLVATVFLCVVFPNMRLVVGVGGVCFALGGLLLPEAKHLGQYTSEALRLTASLWHSESQKMRVVVLRRIQQLRGRIRDWKWKSIPVSRIFSTNH